MTDKVDHPAHYNQGGIECIDALDAIGIAEDFALGNAIKYLWRSRSKGVELEDLRKAQWYINWLIQKRQKPVQVETETPKEVATLTNKELRDLFKSDTSRRGSKHG